MSNRYTFEQTLTQEGDIRWQVLQVDADNEFRQLRRVLFSGMITGEATENEKNMILEMLPTYTDEAPSEKVQPTAKTQPKPVVHQKPAVNPGKPDTTITGAPGVMTPEAETANPGPKPTPTDSGEVRIPGSEIGDPNTKSGLPEWLEAEQPQIKKGSPFDNDASTQPPQPVAPTVTQQDVADAAGALPRRSGSMSSGMIDSFGKRGHV